MRSSSSVSESPAHSANSAFVGLLAQWPSRPITIGVADAGMLNWRSSASACSSASRSIQRNGMAFRRAKSRSRCASGEKREPMILTTEKPWLRSSSRRMRNALRMVSPTSGSSSTARRSSAVFISSTRPSRATRALTTAARPVSMSTSPVNWPGSCTATTRGSSCDSSRISMAPSSTT